MQQESDQSQTSVNFTEIEARVFTQVGEDFYIGREKVDASLRSVLRDEARYIQNSRIWELMNASALNEAYHLALIKSTEYEHVRFAKALKHWSHFMVNVLHKLSK